MLPQSLVTLAYLAAGLLFILSLAACPPRSPPAGATCSASSAWPSP